jgi:PRTRC genetic system protein B
MGVGTPLTQKMMASLMNNVQASTKQLDMGLYGTMPEGVLYCDTRIDHDRLVWYHGPEERCVYFSEGLNIPSGKMMVPGLIYVVHDKRLSLYAFKGKKPTGKLYRAPFMNTVEDVCLGSAKVKYPEEKTFVNVIAYWEKMFWQSEFSHLSGNNPINGNLAVLTKHLISTGEPFPTDVLIEIKNKKLSDLLK